MVGVGDDWHNGTAALAGKPTTGVTMMVMSYQGPNEQPIGRSGGRSGGGNGSAASIKGHCFHRILGNLRAVQIISPSDILLMNVYLYN